MKNLLSIGEFAKASRLSVKTLRHYDKAAVLVPAHVDSDSGYRYYSVSQLTLAERVRLLRSLEVPLPEIKSALGGGEEAVRHMLERHRERMESRLAETREVLSSLNTLLREETLMSYTVNTKTVHPQPIISIDTTTPLAGIGSAIHEGLGKLFAYLGTVGANPVGPPGTLYLDDDIDEVEALRIRIFVPTSRPLSGNAELTGSELPAATLAHTVHAGPFSEVGPAYQAVIGWASENGYRIAGPARETYLAKGERPEENRAEVAYPIEAVSG